jgi:hypothetical protein
MGLLRPISSYLLNCPVHSGHHICKVGPRAKFSRLWDLLFVPPHREGLDVVLLIFSYAIYIIWAIAQLMLLVFSHMRWEHIGRSHCGWGSPKCCVWDLGLAACEGLLIRGVLPLTELHLLWAWLLTYVYGALSSASLLFSPFLDVWDLFGIDEGLALNLHLLDLVLSQLKGRIVRSCLLELCHLVDDAWELIVDLFVLLLRGIRPLLACLSRPRFLLCPLVFKFIVELRVHPWKSKGLRNLALWEPKSNFFLEGFQLVFHLRVDVPLVLCDLPPPAGVRDNESVWLPNFAWK